jgi:hypothetical protein
MISCKKLLYEQLFQMALKKEPFAGGSGDEGQHSMSSFNTFLRDCPEGLWRREVRMLLFPRRTSVVMDFC